jgi:hypothetical protein
MAIGRGSLIGRAPSGRGSILMFASPRWLSAIITAPRPNAPTISRTRVRPLKKNRWVYAGDSPAPTAPGRSIHPREVSSAR